MRCLLTHFVKVFFWTVSLSSVTRTKTNGSIPCRPQQWKRDQLLRSRQIYGEFTVMLSSENITKASSESKVVLGAHCSARLWRNVKCVMLKSAFMINLKPYTLRGQLRSFPPNVQSLHYNSFAEMEMGHLFAIHDPCPLHFIRSMGLGEGVTLWYWSTLSVLKVKNRRLKLSLQQ